MSGWTAVALARDLSKGGVFRTFVGDHDIAIWRSRSGVVRAWDNRCPHRGMRLSFGFVREESLTCIYHGWRYGTDGICRYIPAHPDLTPPKTLCTTAYACVERGPLLWVSTADDPIDVVPALGDAVPVRSLAVDHDIDDVRAMATDAYFPIDESWEPGRGDFTSIDAEPDLIVLKGHSNDVTRTLIMALQPLPDRRTAVHALTSPDATSALARKLSRWLERFRWFAENPTMPTASWSPFHVGRTA